MSRVRVHNSLDLARRVRHRRGAGRSSTPFGHAGHRLHEWMFATRFAATQQSSASRSRHARASTTRCAERHGPRHRCGDHGRRQFGPPGWQDDPEWRGWWGDNPPFHTPTYVLTHRPRPSLEMEGGTTFHFLDAAPADALEVARDAAAGQDVRIGGGPTMLRAFLAAGLSTTCTSCRCRSCSAAVFGCGTAWRRWSSSTTWRRSRRPSGVTHLTFTR